MGVVGRGETEGFLEQGVPCLWHIGDSDLAVQEHALDAEAQDDMQVVCSLVRLDTDRRELRAGDVFQKVVQRKSFELRKVFLRDRIEFFQELGRAPHLVFPRSGLRLMDAQ